VERCDDIRISVTTNDRQEDFSDRRVLLRKISGGLWPPSISCVVYCEDFLSENFSVLREPEESQELFCSSYQVSTFVDREWNRIRELLGLLCSSLESTSWGLASIVQRCQQKFREMRGFFPTWENDFCGVTQKCKEWLLKVGSEGRERFL
jgi:hypothetical protein